MKMIPAWIGVVGALVVCGLVDRRAEAAGGWARAIGGSDQEYGYSCQATSDDGHILAGSTKSFGAGNYDAWCLKVDSSGNITWQKTYGGSLIDAAFTIQQTLDGGYILAGYTTSFGAGSYDAWCLKLDGSGNVTWQKTYGGSNIESVESIQQTTDGGYILAGYTASFGAGGSDAWCLKLDNSGNVTWQKTYGGSSNERAQSIQQTTDGGYVLAGDTTSFGAGGYDAWCLKLDNSGNVTWQKTYGGSSHETAQSIQQTTDGGYVLACYTHSFGAGSYDAWCLKLDSSGNATWQKTYGGSSSDTAQSIQQTTDGGYILAGETASFGAGSYDAWCLKLDSLGSITWQKTYGGSGSEDASCARQTSGGGYAIVGRTGSFGAGNNDLLALRVSSSGDIDSSCGALVLGSAATVTNTPSGGSSTGGAVSDTAIAGMPSSSSASPSPASNAAICSSPAAPDLTGNWSKLSVKGGRIRGTLDCTNAGDAGSGQSVVKVYLSKGVAVGKRSTLVTTVTIGALSPGQISAIKVRATKGSRHKYLLGVIDALGAVAEDDETNNAVAGKL
ncbi:MAG: hypothetical protein HYX75_00090 [Acidobacteria bacterium]|nr:hypothetical protein [Acidobacteriota bacterium]